MAILVERAFLCIGALGKIATVIFMVSTGFTEILFPFGSIQRNARMSMSLESRTAIGTSDRLRVNCLVTARASGHVEG
jgi:hypothetical protein